jgi:hypothetical protein
MKVRVDQQLVTKRQSWTITDEHLIIRDSTQLKTETLVCQWPIVSCIVRTRSSTASRSTITFNQFIRPNRFDLTGKEQKKCIHHCIRNRPSSLLLSSNVNERPQNET